MISEASRNGTGYGNWQGTNYNGNNGPSTGSCTSNSCAAPENPKLKMTPECWRKLLYFRDAGNTEVGAYGVVDRENPLQVIELHFLAQKTSGASVELEDDAVVEFHRAQCNAGREPWEFSRVWVHTHPGNSATPSSYDESQFRRLFGDCSWAIMLIVAKGGEVYCRLQVQTGGIKVYQKIDVDIVASAPPAEWVEEFQANIQIQNFQPGNNWNNNNNTYMGNWYNPDDRGGPTIEWYSGNKGVSRGHYVNGKWENLPDENKKEPIKIIGFQPPEQGKNKTNGTKNGAETAPKNPAAVSSGGQKAHDEFSQSKEVGQQMPTKSELEKSLVALETRMTNLELAFVDEVDPKEIRRLGDTWEALNQRRGQLQRLIEAEVEVEAEINARATLDADDFDVGV